MTPVAAEQFLRALGATKFDKTTLPWLTASCVLAQWRHEHGTDRKPSMGILTGNFKPRIHCFSCQFSGDPEALLGDLKLYSKGQFPISDAVRVLESIDDGAMFDLTPDQTETPAIPMPFPETFWNSFPHIQANSWPHRYLNGRGVTDQEIKQYDWRWDGMEQRVCAPVRGRDHLLYGIRGRYIGPGRDTHEPRYWSYLCGGANNPSIWYGEDWVDVHTPVLVVESVFGAIAARKCYPNVVAPLSAGITAAQVQRLGDVSLWVHLFDADKAGSNASAKLQSIAKHAKHIVLSLPSGNDPDSTVVKYGMPCLRGIISRSLPVYA